MFSNSRVVNLKFEDCDIRIDRSSKWRNPFIIDIDGTREEVIIKYKNWIMTQPELLNSLDELKNKKLGCWCYPKACHGNVLINLLESK
jgi:Domain of unknown function (DUF4326)